MRRVFYQTSDGRLLASGADGGEDEEEAAELASAAERAERWRAQLARDGYATCPHQRCRLSLLTLQGMVGHFRTCPGVTTREGSVECTICGVRFRNFHAVQKHQSRVHYGAAATMMSSPPLTSAPSSSSSSTSSVPSVLIGERASRVPPPGPSRSTERRAYAGRIPAPPPDDDDGDGVEDATSRFLPDEVFAALDNSPSQSTESPAAQASRIMAESKLISTVLPRGRPPRSYRQQRAEAVQRRMQAENLQYRDTFDVMQVGGDITCSGPGHGRNDNLS